jgi:SAM-dependent methyltransferase
MKPVPRGKLEALILRQVAVNLLRLIRRRLFLRKIRSPEVVFEEYDQSYWKRRRYDKAWNRYSSVVDFVSWSHDHTPGYFYVDGSVMEGERREYYSYRTRKVISLIKTYASDSSGIVELGCGSGHNLLALASNGNSLGPLMGLDVSENAIDAARAAADHFNVDSVSFALIDLTDPESPGFSHIKDKIVFTYFCLEQLSRSMDRAIENVLRAGPRRVIHIEPTREILSWTSLRDLNEIIYSLAMDYPNDLLSCLRKKEAENRLRVTEIRPLDYAAKIRGFPVLAVWEPLPNGKHEPRIDVDPDA